MIELTTLDFSPWNLGLYSNSMDNTCWRASLAFLALALVIGHPSPSSGSLPSLLVMPSSFSPSLEGFVLKSDSPSASRGREWWGQWKPIQIVKRTRKLSHLALVDNLLLYAEASEEQVKMMVHIIDLFSKSSSQKVSNDNTRIYFSNNVGWQW